METPSSTRRVTRSQTSAASANNSILHSSKKIEEPEMTRTTKGRQMSAKKQQQDRSALIDITNDSPIVGLAMGNLRTPSSSSSSSSSSWAMTKKKGMGLLGACTPGSGEALLRGQVKTLLQKVEEEADLPSKININNRPCFFINNLRKGFVVNSPNNLVAAPTPANTPQLFFSSAANHTTDALTFLTSSPVDEKFLLPLQMLCDESKKEEGIVSENVITRSLLLDFSEIEGGEETEGSQEKLSVDSDDNESAWSIQVNVSEHQEEEEESDDYYEEEEEDDGFCGNLLDVLCEGMSKISVKEEGPKFEGKHIRFVYNSEDEMMIEGDDDDGSSSSSTSCSGVLRLKGLPTPKGKHLRFPEDEEESQHNNNY